MHTSDHVELLAPAGDFETALAAFEAGADAVYCGLVEYSARAFAKNLTLEELGRLVAFARAKGRRVYVTFNTLVEEASLDDVIGTLSRLEQIGPDALIVQDLGVARLCRRHFPGLALHASTQLCVHNLEGVLAMRDLGFTRVVPARELSLSDISFISARCGGMELECFIHGALCYSISGLCLFSAMEKGRSGNCGRCAYCCRLPYSDGTGAKKLPFSMKDLRLGEDALRLVQAGVTSLKMEGRMKSALYVASATAYYRAILDGRAGKSPVTVADLETVFSRRTTKLYLDGPADDVIDPSSLGHLGTPVGTVKRITKDREGRCWLRFHTSRALEKHDGLQFAAPDGGKPLGFGIQEMRKAISRVPVYEVAAGTDVEIHLPEDGETDWSTALKSGATVYCSMSNAVKRRFPQPSYRPADYPEGPRMDVRLELAPDAITATASAAGEVASCTVKAACAPAKNPGKTYDAAAKAFSKLGGTGYAPGRLELIDPDRLFAPMSVLNDLRRDVVGRLDDLREKTRRAKEEEAKGDAPDVDLAPQTPRRTVKLRADQTLPQGEWDEIVVAVSLDRPQPPEAFRQAAPVRLALPVYTTDGSFGRLRVLVKRLVREGYEKWEASDLATLRMLKAAGVSDISADWTLYATNSRSLAGLSELGCGRFVASPENSRENLQFLAESGYDVEFLCQQSTPLFISATKPAADRIEGLAVSHRDGLWITTRPVPRTFDLPDGVSTRLDLSWEAE